MTPPRPVKRKQTIQLPVPPSANDRLLVATDNNTGKPRMFSTSVVRRYRKAIALPLLFLKPIPAPRDVRATIIWHQKTDDVGDLDNRIKLTLDVLSGHGYDDDRQITELHVYLVRDQRAAAFLVTIEDLTP